MSSKSIASVLRWCVLAAVVIASGCSKGIVPLTPKAKPLGLKLHAALKKMEVSDMSGCIQTAEQMAATNEITRTDFEQLRKVRDMGQESNWNAATADLEVMLGMRK